MLEEKLQFKTEWDLDKEFGYTVDQAIADRLIKEYSLNVDSFVEKWNKGSQYLFENFKEYLDESSNLNACIYPYMRYLSLKSSVDTSDQEIQKLTAYLYKSLEPMSEKLLFLTTYFKEIGYDKLMKLSNEIKEYSNYIVSQADSVKYTLSEKEEYIIMKLNGGSDLYDEYKTSITLPYKGEEKTLTDIWGDRTSSNREDRILSYKILSDFYNKEYNNVIFKNIYSDVCKDNVTSMEIRNIKGVMTSRNESEELDDEVVNKLIHIVESNYSIFSEYLKMKKKFLKLDDFNVYDILAPFGDASEKLSYEKGCEMYLETIKKVDESLYNHGVEMLSGKTDVYPKKGKRGGAFCAYDKHGESQYVLLNWQDKLDDLNTLAHEFGHAFHGMLSLKQNNLQYHSPLVLAETASIFNETVIFNQLLNQTKSKDDRDVLIFNRLDDLFSTIFRQIMYIKFEQICHESWKNNVPLGSDDYNTIWLNEFKSLVGDSIEWNKENEDMVKWGWMSIPHIYHTPFYCYAYAFGCLLSLNVYNSYVKSSDTTQFKEQYFDLLRAGGSQRPKELLSSIFGYDIESDEFYLSGIEYIKYLMSLVK